MLDFRKTTNDDAPILKQIAERVIRSNYVSFLGIEMVNHFIENGMSDKEIDNGINDCIVALLDEQIIGFAITKEDLLHLIMIDVPYQNKGYGSQLLFHVEGNMLSRFTTIKLQSFKENENSVHFYLKKGWIVKNEEFLSELNKSMLLFEKVSQEQKT